MDEAGEFREVPIEAVDCALLVLGESVRQVMYDRVERNYQIKREEIPVMLERGIEQATPHPSGVG